MAQSDRPPDNSDRDDRPQPSDISKGPDSPNNEPVKVDDDFRFWRPDDQGVAMPPAPRSRLHEEVWTPGSAGQPQVQRPADNLVAIKRPGGTVFIVGEGALAGCQCLDRADGRIEYVDYPGQQGRSRFDRFCEPKIPTFFQERAGLYPGDRHGAHPEGRRGYDPASDTLRRFLSQPDQPRLTSGPRYQNRFLQVSFW